MSNRIIEIVADADVLARTAADRIARAARESVDRCGRFTLVLTGGSTPEKTYVCLASPERSGAVDWSRTYLFFGDERFVPPEDPASNFGMARRSLLAHVPVPAAHIFPMTTSATSAREAAEQYARDLAHFCGLPAHSSPSPCFDLVLLGLGDDGHTASLFPGKPALNESEKWVTWSPPGRLPPPVDRITLTFPVFNAARQVLFLVSGERKADVLKEVLEEKPPRDKYPAAGVSPLSGTVTWLLDAAAASRLSGQSKPK
jgi:6-phosphogluconolactonase